MQGSNGKAQVLNPLTDSFTSTFLKIYKGEPGPGGASHEYTVTDFDGNVIAEIKFQKGPRQEAGTNGLLEGTLLQIILDRQQAFQAGEMRCRENALVVTKLEEAMLWLKARELDRAQRGTLGTMNK